MSLQIRLQTHKLFIADTMQELLAAFTSQRESLPLARETAEKLSESLFGGKMLRGSLICLTYQWLTRQNSVPKAVYQLAAAEEIFASALLIHDDVMDRDKIRRGKLSVFAQYEQEASSISDQAEHYGYSQAIMVGDICFFWVQQIIAELDIPSETRLQLQSILATESIRTGLGQMLDVNAAMLKTPLAQEDIESISLNKTARYTFVLPFLLGATVANAETTTLLTLEKLGNAMGTLFQIKDDELGLFGSEAEIGKPEGNDVKEGKQTLFYFFAKQQLTGQDLETFTTLYGSKINTSTTFSAGNEELKIVRDLVESSGAFDKVQNILTSYAQTSNELISELPISDADRTDLEDFLKFNLQRKR